MVKKKLKYFQIVWGHLSDHIWNNIKSWNSQLTDIEEQLETDSIPIKEEEEEDIPEDTDESERSSEKEEKPTMPFGDFLDLMEVFWAQTCSFYHCRRGVQKSLPL